MGALLCPCSRNTVKLTSFEDESHEPMMRNEETNKDNITLKIGQNNNNNITWKYGSIDKNQQNHIINVANNNDKSRSKNHQYNNKEMSSFDELLKKNGNNSDNYNHDNENDNDNGNEDSDVSEISDVADDDNNDNIETLPTTLSISTETIIVSNAGFEPINGEYRWFLHAKKWCLFREDNSYCIENNIDVQQVYTQLLSLQNKNANFRWKETIDSCWIIADFEGNTIYYAAPQYDNDTIPKLSMDLCSW